jgi:hypothetical protein
MLVASFWRTTRGPAILIGESLVTTFLIHESDGVRCEWQAHSALC